MTQCKECFAPTTEPDGVCKACKIAEFEEQYPELAADQDGHYGWAKRAEDQRRDCESLKAQMLEILGRLEALPNPTAEDLAAIASARETLAEYEADMQKLRALFAE